MNDLTNKTSVRLPVAVLISLHVATATAGGVYGVMKYKNDDAATKALAVDTASIERDTKIEHRVEKIEDTLGETKILLGRIDERTGSTANSVAEIRRELAKRPELK